MVEILELAKELEQKGKYEEAYDKFYMAYMEKLGSFYTQCDIGRILNKMQKYDSATTWFDSVLEMDELHQESLFGRGISKIGSNNYEDALESLNKLLLLDKKNANAWYYKAIISKELGDTDSNIYFREFKNTDNEKFKEIRSYYKFGIAFYETEYQFRENREFNIISEVKHELESLNLSEQQFLNVFRTIPLDSLFDKIIELKYSKSNDDIKNIIHDELIKHGLTESDVEEMFELESVEELKEEVIELSDENPFLNNKNDESSPKFIPIKKASRYNIYKNVKRLKSDNLYLFNRGNYYYDEKEFIRAIECYDECLKYNPENMMLKFIKFCANYNLKENNNV